MVWLFERWLLQDFWPMNVTWDGPNPGNIAVIFFVVLFYSMPGFFFEAVWKGIDKSYRDYHGSNGDFPLVGVFWIVAIPCLLASRFGTWLTSERELPKVDHVLLKEKGK